MTGLGYVLLGTAVGAFVSGVIAFLMHRRLLNASVEAVRLSAQSQLDLINERVRQIETILHRTQDELLTAKKELDTERRSLQTEVGLRSAAEERAARIPRLEALVAEREKTIEERMHDISRLSGELQALNTRLEEERKAAEEKLRLIEDARNALLESFKSLSADALRSNNQSFLELANQAFQRLQESSQGDLAKRQEAITQLVKPVHENLEKVSIQIQQVEKERAGAFSGLAEQVKQMMALGGQIQSETRKLVTALRQPQTRGRWGEIQLKRVVELAGMQEYCDFEEQVSSDTEQGRLRPDMIVRLPNEKQIVVDSKVSLEAYLRAMEAESEEERGLCLSDHARQVRQHILRLSGKEYWSHFGGTVEFVVLFLPAESFFSAAAMHDPMIIEYAAERRVVLATPTTLIALLKAVAYGWRQEQVSRSAREISALGKELYERLSVLADHFMKMGKNLNQTTDAYNKAVGTLETRVLVTARKFRELGADSGKDMPEPVPIETTTRAIQSEELLRDNGGEAED